MVKPINHGFGSSVSTAYLETVKGARNGLLLFFVAPAAIVGGLSLLAFSWPVALGLGAAAGLVSGGLGGFFGAGFGAVTGALKSVFKISDEKAAFNERMRGHEQLTAIKFQEASQNAYVAGVQDGQAHLVQELQAAQQEQATAFAQRELQKRAAAAQAAPSKTL